MDFKNYKYPKQSDEMQLSSEKDHNELNRIKRGKVKRKGPNEIIRYITDDGVEHTKVRKLPVDGYQGAIRQGDIVTGVLNVVRISATNKFNFLVQWQKRSDEE
jgi:hypothetical protein